MAALEITASGPGHVTAKVLHLTRHELFIMRSAVEQLAMGVSDDCAKCAVGADACDNCQEHADLSQKLCDLESLVDVGVLGLIQIDQKAGD
jgi:hypothetical protein